MAWFRRSILSDRQEAAVQKTLHNLRAQRRNRFRVLACIDGTEESFVIDQFNLLQEKRLAGLHFILFGVAVIRRAGGT